MKPPETTAADRRQVMVDGYKPITTQIFDKDSKYLDDDSVFAVKDSLVVEFVPRKNDPQASHELQYDIMMGPMDSDVSSGPGLSTAGEPGSAHA